MFRRELAKTSFQKEKGSNKKIPEGSLTTSLPKHNNNTTTEKQLDQARLLEGQLRHDLWKKKLQLMELQQTDRKRTSSNNSLGTSKLRNNKQQ